MNLKQQIGQYGQQIAKEFLIKRGYQVIKENYYTRLGEIDLIIKDHNQLVFVEVKTRTSLKFGLPEEAVSQFKKERMINCALQYLSEKEIQDDNYRLDIIAILINKDNKKALIRHHKNI